ncbi:glycosyltransferase family A protein [Arthrobacter sp. AQ5-05]|uniref:glycosyltransferase family 2 protein n=1 Tax=Arthrobacter sp. AQ5-05 TaxID=2184581 RepID=UPI0012B657CC
MTSTGAVFVKPLRTISGVGSVDASEILAALKIPYVPSRWALRDLESVGLPSAPSPGPWHDDYVLAFDSLAQAREALPLLTSEGVAKNLIVVLALPGADRDTTGLKTPELGSGQTLSVRTIGEVDRQHVTQVSGSSWTSIHSFLSAVVGYAANDLRQLPFQGLRIGVSSLASSVWTVGDSLARRIDAAVDQSQIPVVDGVDVLAQEMSRPRGLTEVATCDVSTTRVKFELPPIDPMIFSPCGFDPYPTRGTAEIIPDSDTWAIASNGKAVGRPFSTLNEHVVMVLRDFQYVDISGLVTGSSWPVARMLSQLASAGVPLKTARLDVAVSELLGAGLTAELEEGSPLNVSASQRESRSIDIRRAALKRFLPGPRLGELGLAGQSERFEWPSVSVVLATRRPSLIPQILQQISKQSYVNLETVLAVHGTMELPDGASSAIAAFPGTIRVISFEETVPFGEVLNRSCAAAAGQLVTKMDDDDWYSPSHIEDLVLAQAYSGAQLVGSPVEFAYLDGVDVTTRRSHRGECYTDHLAGGTMLISKEDLRAVGGWRKVLNAVDRGLIDAVLAAGGKAYRTHGQNYVMHRRDPTAQGMEHTWVADHSVFLRDLKDQWDGLVLPPQFSAVNKSPTVSPRAERYRSIFSGV